MEKQILENLVFVNPVSVVSRGLINFLNYEETLHIHEVDPLYSGFFTVAWLKLIIVQKREKIGLSEGFHFAFYFETKVFHGLYVGK